MFKNKDKELFAEVEGRLHNYKWLESEINKIEIEILQVENQYRGCGSINYDDIGGSTYSISKSVENEVINKEKVIGELIKNKSNKEIEKRKIENALTCLDTLETDVFQLFYKSNSKTTMKHISNELHISRSNCYRIRDCIVNKVMRVLY